MQSKEQVYTKAWKRLQKGIQMKTAWGKNELGMLMAGCLQDALDDDENDKEVDGDNV